MAYVVREVLSKDMTTWIRYNHKGNRENPVRQQIREEWKRWYDEAAKQEQIQWPSFGARLHVVFPYCSRIGH